MWGEASHFVPGVWGLSVQPKKRRQVGGQVKKAKNHNEFLDPHAFGALDKSLFTAREYMAGYWR